MFLSREGYVTRAWHKQQLIHVSSRSSPISGTISALELWTSSLDARTPFVSVDVGTFSTAQGYQKAREYKFNQELYILLALTLLAVALLLLCRLSVEAGWRSAQNKLLGVCKQPQWSPLDKNNKKASYPLQTPSRYWYSSQGRDRPRSLWCSLLGPHWRSKVSSCAAQRPHQPISTVDSRYISRSWVRAAGLDWRPCFCKVMVCWKINRLPVSYYIILYINIIKMDVQGIIQGTTRRSKVMVNI